MIVVVIDVLSVCCCFCCSCCCCRTDDDGDDDDHGSRGGKKDKKLSKKDKKAAKKEAKKAKKAAKKAAAKKSRNNSSNSDEGAGAENSASDDVDPVPADASSTQEDALATSMSHVSLDTGSAASPGQNRQRQPARASSILDPSASAGLLEDATEKRASNAAFRKMLRARAMLPAHEKRDAILTAVAEHQVVVVSGDTGCGKTTQIPQFILDDAIKRGKGGECSIVCTQVNLRSGPFGFLFRCRVAAASVVVGGKRSGAACRAVLCCAVLYCAERCCDALFVS